MTDTSRPFVALLWMLVAAASFSAMAVAGREIQTEMNTFELMLYRSAIGFAVVAFLVFRKPGGADQLRTAQPGRHVIRNVVHFTGQNLWFYALALIPLGQVIALEFTNPIWVALLAPFMLSEKLTPMRIVAAIVGFFGVLLIAQPGSSAIEIGHAAALGCAFFFALTNIMTKQIRRDDSMMCILFWMTLSQTLMSLVLSLPGGIPGPTAEMAPWLLTVGLAGLSAHYSLTSALTAAPAIFVAPLEFIRLPVFVLIGAWLYGETLNTAVYLGATIIVLANLGNILAEWRRIRA